MPAVEHRTHILLGSALVVEVGRAIPAYQVDTFQARCECGYHGPRRTRRWEAEDDETNHKSNPQEEQ